MTTALNTQRPFHGLEAYGEVDKESFGGRSIAVEALMHLVSESKVTVVFGKSGIGKTSLVQAGLIPRLRQDLFVPVYVRMGLFSGMTGIDALELAIIEQLSQQFRLPSTYHSLWQLLHDPSIFNGFLVPVLIFDQVEEMLNTDFHNTAGMATFLSTLIENRVPRMLSQTYGQRGEIMPSAFGEQHYRVVLSLREDYLQELEDLNVLLPSLRYSRFRVAPFTMEEAEEALLHTGQHVLESRSVARKIVNKMPVAIASGYHRLTASGQELSPPSVEPFLLSLFAYQLNEKRLQDGDVVISSALVDQINADSVLETYFDQVVKGPHFKDEDALTTGVEEALISPTGLRRLELEETLTKEYGIYPQDLEMLIKARVIRREYPRGPEPYIELIHDRLANMLLQRRDLRKSRELADREKHKIQKELDHERVQGSRKKKWVAAFAIVAISFCILCVFAWEKSVQATNAKEKAEEATAIAESEAKVAEQTRNTLKKMYDVLEENKNNLDSVRNQYFTLLERYDTLIDQQAELETFSSILTEKLQEQSLRNKEGLDSIKVLRSRNDALLDSLAEINSVRQHIAAEKEQLRNLELGLLSKSLDSSRSYQVSNLFIASKIIDDAYSNIIDSGFSDRAKDEILKYVKGSLLKGGVSGFDPELRVKYVDKEKGLLYLLKGVEVLTYSLFDKKVTDRFALKSPIRNSFRFSPLGHGFIYTQINGNTIYTNLKGEQWIVNVLGGNMQFIRNSNILQVSKNNLSQLIDLDRYIGLDSGYVFTSKGMVQDAIYTGSEFIFFTKSGDNQYIRTSSGRINRKIASPKMSGYNNLEIAATKLIPEQAAYLVVWQSLGTIANPAKPPVLWELRAIEDDRVLHTNKGQGISGAGNFRVSDGLSCIAVEGNNLLLAYKANGYYDIIAYNLKTGQSLFGWHTDNALRKAKIRRLLGQEQELRSLSYDAAKNRLYVLTANHGGYIKMGEANTVIDVVTYPIRNGKELYVMANSNFMFYKNGEGETIIVYDNVDPPTDMVEYSKGLRRDLQQVWGLAEL